MHKDTLCAVAVGAGVAACVLGAYAAYKRHCRNAAQSCGAPASESKLSGEALLRPIVMCGPSGAGKSTLVHMLEKEYGEAMGFSVSHTTRKPRAKEVDGIHYNFTDMDSIQAAIEDNQFIESALVHGNMYGTSFDAVRRVREQGKVCVLDIDIQGVKKCQQVGFDAMYIMVSPPSVDCLRERLEKRGSETPASLKQRLLDAEEELREAAVTRFDARIVNDDLQVAFAQLKEIVRPQLAAVQAHNTSQANATPNKK